MDLQPYCHIRVTNFDKHQDAPTGYLNGGQKQQTYVFREYYVCHLSGSKRVHAGVVRGGASGHVRGLQKRSKKSNCPATLKVVCLPSDPSMVTITHSDNQNHEIGSRELPFLPVLVSVRALNNVLARDSTHRPTLIYADEIYNIYKRIQEASYQRHPNHHQSVRACLSELQQENFETFEGRDFMDSVCLDATHSTTSSSNGILYTIVTHHPLIGTGCSVAFFFTIDQSMGPLANFWRFLRNQAGILNIAKITIDVSSTELGAIQAVYASASVEWCWFLVARAWTGKIRQLVNPGDTHHNNTVQNNITADLKAMMSENDRPFFKRKLTTFITDLSGYRNFLQYFKSVPGRQCVYAMVRRIPIGIVH
ncbi:uncharacterized protein EV154DRAFT_569019 [Mucor mucedo]|uniref:uncharacterized protein n=1 Tax=Mucor mucedo TaxID=29922 RepID=UPI002220851C|nr:uncharacterized protein EV154DRAFT_569019 [Mucor mucedo]KAI7877674.1 hypothetical protein EV154DRAFT_569019 [Mucor mucedo]